MTIIPERDGLESSIAADGCRDALVVWGDILVDGHNRFEICTRLGIEYRTVSKEFSDREAAADWIDSNQLGRRNLSPDQMSFIRGRRYNRTKKAQGGTGANQFKQTAQNGHSAPTAESLAVQHGVSATTIRRDGADAALLDQHPSPSLEPITRTPRTPGRG